MMINIQKAYEVYILQINFVPRIVRLSFVTAYNSMKHLCWNKNIAQINNSCILLFSIANEPAATRPAHHTHRQRITI